jgi:hypothetical protein
LVGDVELHLRLLDQRPERELLADAGGRELVWLGELPADDGDGGYPVSGETAVVIVVVTPWEIPADGAVRVAFARAELGKRGEALVEVGDGGLPERLEVRRGKVILVGDRVRRRCPDLLDRRLVQADRPFPDLVLRLVAPGPRDRSPALLR